MKLEFDVNKTPLQIAVEKENPEIVKILLSTNETDVNYKSIQISILNTI